MGLLTKTGGLFAVAVLSISALVAGCGGEEAEVAPKATVKVMKVMRQNTPISYGFPGHLQGRDEVEVHSRVSGSVVEKYFHGGDVVRKGQPLYKIDPRQYETAVLEAQAKVHKAESNLRNASEDLARFEALLRDQAISEQTVTNKRADVDGYLATLESERAVARKAQENLDDTIVYAPMDGRASVDDVAVGTYATAGATNLVSVGTIDPIYVQFSISEVEYLNLLAEAMDTGATLAESAQDPPKIKITLSNGKEYPYTGEIVTADRSLSEQSGSLTIKALIPNPQGILLPGMFTNVHFVDIVAENALLVPARAVQQLLDESFVLVVGEDGTSVSKKVKLGEKVGSYYIIESGLSDSDTVIVEGLTNLKSGAPLEVVTVTPDDMGFSVYETSEVMDKS